ncbi:MAG: 3-dehydroquinate synthase [Maribacter sp.]|nr:3-dehydroquinate synthase [Maribacter sp.]
MFLKPIEQSFKVSYEYKLHFTKDLFHLDNKLFSDIIAVYGGGKKVKLLFVVDDGVANHHPQLVHKIESYCKAHENVLKYTDTLIVKGGEQSKNDDTSVTKILSSINKKRICRHSFVVVIGGGAVIDMAGYAATIAHRGVKLIRIPTTVLSQNDSAVGVKNGINAFNKKNFVGTFAPPYAIINDSKFLKTLEQRDWIAGVSEAIKVALIKDVEFFQFLENNAIKIQQRDEEIMQYLIYKCAEIHMHHIAKGGDPFESGSSRPLDFGHWAAHKMEQMTNYSLRHGEAVAKGIVLDVVYTQLIGLINENDLKRVIELFEKIGFDLSMPIEAQVDELLNGIEEFREHLGGELTITLLSRIGEKRDVHEIDMQLMKKAVLTLSELNKQKA